MIQLRYTILIHLSLNPFAALRLCERKQSTINNPYPTQQQRFLWLYQL